MIFSVPAVHVPSSFFCHLLGPNIQLQTPLWNSDTHNLVSMPEESAPPPSLYRTQECVYSGGDKRTKQKN